MNKYANHFNKCGGQISESVDVRLDGMPTRFCCNNRAPIINPMAPQPLDNLPDGSLVRRLLVRWTSYFFL